MWRCGYGGFIFISYRKNVFDNFSTTVLSKSTKSTSPQQINKGLQDGYHKACAKCWT